MDPARTARVVEVAPERIGGWVDRFRTRHGPGEVAVGPARDRVLLTAADGSHAEFEVPHPPLPAGDPVPALVAHASAPRRVGVLLVRRGGYAVGVFRGSELVASKVGSGYVQGRTKAGGWSQQRFARRRANQARAVYTSATEAAVAILVPERNDLDALVTGGDRSGVSAVLEDARLSPLQRLVTPRLLSVPDPRLRVLRATPEQFRAVRVSVSAPADGEAAAGRVAPDDP